METDIIPMVSPCKLLPMDIGIKQESKEIICLTNSLLLTLEKSQSDKMFPGGFGMVGLSLFESHGEAVV
jgi:hypothetical protein